MGDGKAGSAGELSSSWLGNQMQAQKIGECVFGDGALGEGQHGSKSVGILGDELKSVVEKEQLRHH